jgi:proteic killer suppression protein
VSKALRLLAGCGDHALKGDWKGYRAIRLSQAYRAIYIVHEDNRIETVYVEEVNKHDY